MTENYLVFKEFNAIEIATEIGEILKRNNIDIIIEKEELNNSVFGVSNLNNNIKLKINKIDFTNAQKIIDNYYKELITSVPDDYYLFTFSIDELSEIVLKPWEWGEFDVNLAQKILTEKGVSINSAEKEKRTEEYLFEQSKQKNVNELFLLLGYIVALLGGFLSIIFGYVLAYSKKTLPNGEQMFVYIESVRKHGKIIYFAGIVSVILWTIIILFFSPAYKNN